MNAEEPLHILVVDDEEHWLHGISLTLARNGLPDVVTCQDGREVPKILAERRVGLILLDITMPGISGEAVLAKVAEEHPEIPVIVITGLNQIESSVRCMKLGAYDYFVKTVEEGPLIACVRRALDMVELRGENRLLKRNLLGSALRRPEAFSGMHSVNPRMRAVFGYIDAVAESSQPVCITGESGTGKELMARAVHLSSRPAGPFVAVNVAGLDDTVFADTLFGHDRGAFTGAENARQGLIRQAAGGTLFLDEIGDLSQASQVKLLRLLQESEFFPLGGDKPLKSQARIVASTNQNLKALGGSGRFRKDLYYRLRTHLVELPPLRDRREDIPLLTNLFLGEIAAELGKRPPTPPGELYALLSSYHFPGNVRELKAMIHDAVSRHQHGKLSLSSFRQAMREGVDDRGRPGRDIFEDFDLVQDQEVRFPERLPSLDAIQDALVVEAMRRAGNNQTIAAGLLGISQPSLSRRLKNMRQAQTDNGHVP
jgi:DNA-binding NtrC family response regulator